MVGDFNCHHNLWYAELDADTRIYNNIRIKKKHGDTLVEYIQHYNYTLSNIPGTITHFPRNSNTPTIINFTFLRRHVTTITSGLPQGSPLSPIPFVIYAAVLSPPRPQLWMRETTTYVDDEVMIQGTTSQKAGSKALQTRLDERIRRASHLNIQFVANKVELIHLVPHTNSGTGAHNTTCITLYGTPVLPKTSVKSLGVWIDDRLNPKPTQPWQPQIRVGPQGSSGASSNGKESPQEQYTTWPCPQRYQPCCGDRKPSGPAPNTSSDN